MHVSPSLGEVKESTYIKHIMYKDKANEHSKINANYVPVKHTQAHKYSQSFKSSELYMK